MPFPLAHPAAVLPLRRYCPQRLCLPALVIGSLTPDAGYLFGEETGGALSHQFLGSIVFCLPVGVVLVVLFHILRRPMVKLLPAPYRRVLLPLCEGAGASVGAVILSLLIGAWTHLLWDSFTHKDGWCVQNLPLLATALFSVGSHTVRVCHLLWYGCSFAGVIWLFLVFEKWKQANLYGGVGVATWSVILDAVLVAALVLPIALVHHLVRGHHLGLLLVAGLCAIPVLGIALKLGRASDGAAAQRSRSAGPSPG
jgi:hypothetical protein